MPPRSGSPVPGSLDGLRGHRSFAPALPASLTLVLDASDPGQVARAAGTQDLVIAATRPAVDTQGRSALSMEDFAIAVLDEAERPTVRRGLLSIGR